MRALWSNTWVVVMAASAAACASGRAPSAVVTPAATPVATESAPEVVAAPPLDPVVEPSSLAATYGPVVANILAAAVDDRGAWDKLSHLTDRIGARLAGSASLEQAIAWAAAAMRADGHDNVRTERVMVPHWVRGAESLALVAPIARELPMLGLGGTVATPKRGLTAEVVVVDSFDALAALGDAVRGKIVLFDVPMAAYTFETSGDAYDAVVEYRAHGASRAAALGAAAVLVRSATTRSLRTPHTGALRYATDAPQIPAAAVTTEDAALLSRLAAAGEPVRARLVTSGRTLADAESANVLAELVGRERPDEIVLLGAHIDSWDVGQGAHDDGAGCVIVMQALALLRRLGLQPRRTIRVVLFTNEENGLRGAFGYAAQHADEIAGHVAGLESDSGGYAPVGFRLERSDAAALGTLGEIAALLAPVGATRVEAGFSGADLIPLTKAGMPGLGLWVDETHYFDVHHTHADTLDKVDPAHLARNVGAVAAMAYVLAELPDRLAVVAPSE